MFLMHVLLIAQGFRQLWYDLAVLRRCFTRLEGWSIEAALMQPYETTSTYEPMTIRPDPHVPAFPNYIRDATSNDD